jgi:hypothetical protein
MLKKNAEATLYRALAIKGTPNISLRDKVVDQ